MTIENYEGVENQGWWWYSQILLGEAKSQKSAKNFKIYCDTFIEYLESYGPHEVREKRGRYGPRKETI